MIVKLIYTISVDICMPSFSNSMPDLPLKPIELSHWVAVCVVGSIPFSFMCNFNDSKFRVFSRSLFKSLSNFEIEVLNSKYRIQPRRPDSKLVCSEGMLIASFINWSKSSSISSGSPVIKSFINKYSIAVPIVHWNSQAEFLDLDYPRLIPICFQQYNCKKYLCIIWKSEKEI